MIVGAGKAYGFQSRCIFRIAWAANFGIAATSSVSYRGLQAGYLTVDCGIGALMLQLSVRCRSGGVRIISATGHP
jgi:hypothetical protein